VLIHNNILV